MKFKLNVPYYSITKELTKQLLKEMEVQFEWKRGCQPTKLNYPDQEGVCFIIRKCERGNKHNILWSYTHMCDKRIEYTGNIYKTETAWVIQRDDGTFYCGIKYNRKGISFIYSSKLTDAYVGDKVSCKTSIKQNNLINALPVKIKMQVLKNW